MPATFERQLTVKEVAEALQVDQVTVRRMIGRGELPAYRYGKSRLIRIDPKDLRKLRRPVTSLSREVTADA